MNARSAVGSVLAVGLVAGLAVGCATPTPRIGKAEAAQIALAKVPGGTVKECELERERGRRVWSFDIARPGTPDITEVLVDATSGEVVAVENETPADQAKEEHQDRGGKK